MLARFVTSQPKGGETKKVSGVLGVSFSGVNHGVWSHLGSSGRDENIFNREGFFYGFAQRNDKKGCHVRFKVVSFRESNWSPLGININFPTSISQGSPRISLGFTTDIHCSGLNV